MTKVYLEYPQTDHLFLLGSAKLTSLTAVADTDAILTLFTEHILPGLSARSLATSQSECMPHLPMIADRNTSM